MKGHHLESFRGKQKEAVGFMVLEGIFGAFQQARLKVTGGWKPSVGLLQKGSYTGFHLACSLVCEGEGEDLMGMPYTAQKFNQPRDKKHGFAGTRRGLYLVALRYIKCKLSGLVIWGEVHIIHYALIAPRYRNLDKPAPRRLGCD
jgi:hypothetical protein